MESFNVSNRNSKAVVSVPKRSKIKQKFKEDEVELSDTIDVHSIPDFDDKFNWIYKEEGMSSNEGDINVWLSEAFINTKHDGVLLGLLQDIDSSQAHIINVEGGVGFMPLTRPQAEAINPSARQQDGGFPELKLAVKENSNIGHHLYTTDPNSLQKKNILNYFKGNTAEKLQGSSESKSRCNVTDRQISNVESADLIQQDLVIAKHSKSIELLNATVQDSPPRTNCKEQFQPSSVSTPTSKFCSQNCEDLVDDDSVIHECNVTDPGTYAAEGNATWKVNNTLLLSRSDPSIIDSVQSGSSSHQLKSNGTFTKTSQSHSILSDQGTDKNSTFIYDKDDDNASSASESSFSSMQHIRSLGDVRTLARQQEESLMRVLPTIKKGISDDSGIHTNVIDPCPRTSSNYGSASSINSNNNNANVGGMKSRFTTPLLRGSHSHNVLRGTRTLESNPRLTNFDESRATSLSRGSAIRAPGITSRIPRSRQGPSRIPTASNRGNANTRGNWRDGCF